MELILLFIVCAILWGYITLVGKGKIDPVVAVAGNSAYDSILSSTIADYKDTFVDNVSKSYLFFWWLTGQGGGGTKRTRSQDGGESILEPLMYGKNTTVRSYSGYEVLDTTPQEGLTSAQFPWKQLAGTVSISRLEERKNSGKHRMINLLDAKVRQTEITMREELNRMLFGDGTGNGSRDLFGLDLLVENGSVWGTVGGIDRSDSLNAWWRNQWAGTVGSFATNGLSSMRTMYNNASRGNEHPDLGLTTQSIFEAFEASQVPNQRFVDEKIANAGFEALKFKGMVLGYDEQCSSGAMFFLNSAYLDFVYDKDTWFETTEFVRPNDQDARSSQILVMGNFCLSNSARQGRLDGITTP